MYVTGVCVCVCAMKCSEFPYAPLLPRPYARKES